MLKTILPNEVGFSPKPKPTTTFICFKKHNLFKKQQQQNSMALKFEDVSFENKEDSVRIHFLKIFYTDINKSDLEKLSKFRITKNSISFEGIPDSRAESKFNFLLGKAFESLKNSITGKKTVYIHQLSGIPLIGNSAFGLVDRNTSIIEVRPITGCNLNCIYCSVDQDKRPVDFVVEKDYLITEFKKLVDFKQINEIEAHIGTQGEPLLYAPLPDLIKDLSQLKEVSTIALDTNGTLLTKELIDRLISSGLTRFCFSINALSQALAEKIAGCHYNLKKILEMLDYVSKKKCQLILTPVWIPGINDSEIPKLIELSKKLNCSIGIQNFLNYRFGKNPAKQMDWDIFIQKMKELENIFKAHLLFDFKKDFNIRQTKSLPKPFRKGSVIRAKIVCQGRLKNEMLAVADNRTITIPNCYEKAGKIIKLRITRDKHNIFYGMKL